MDDPDVRGLSDTVIVARGAVALLSHNGMPERLRDWLQGQQDDRIVEAVARAVCDAHGERAGLLTSVLGVSVVMPPEPASALQVRRM